MLHGAPDKQRQSGASVASGRTTGIRICGTRVWTFTHFIERPAVGFGADDAD